MCDVTIATTGASIGMGGPAMIEGGGLGTVTAADVGPLDMQVRNGVVDLAVADDAAAVDHGPALPGLVPGADRRLGPVPTRRAAAGRGAPSADGVPMTSGRAVELIADTGSVIELRPRFGRSIVTAMARLEGRPVGVIANNPMHLAGAINSDAADKAARFLQLCDAFGRPVISLVDTPGIMVGPDAEATALVRHAARLFTAGAVTHRPAERGHPPQGLRPRGDGDDRRQLPQLDLDRGLADR